MTDIEMEHLLARLQRDRAETDKYVDEGRKLRAEAGKLDAEGRKFQRERTTLAMTSGAAILGAGAVLGQLAVRLIGGH